MEGKNAEDRRVEDRMKKNSR